MILNTPPDSGQNWKEIVKKLKPQIIEKIKQVVSFDVSDRIFVEKIVNPTNLVKNTNSYTGSLHDKSKTQ